MDTDLAQKRYECMREVHLGIRQLSDSLKAYDLSLGEYNSFKALYNQYSSIGLLGIQVKKIDNIFRRKPVLITVRTPHSEK